MIVQVHDRRRARVVERRRTANTVGIALVRANIWWHRMPGPKPEALSVWTPVGKRARQSGKVEYQSILNDVQLISCIGEQAPDTLVLVFSIFVSSTLSGLAHEEG